MSEQITVSGNILAVQLWALFRQILPIASAFAVGRGYIAEDVVTAVGGVIGIVAPVIIGQVLTRNRSKTLVKLANAVPDPVAVVR